MLVELARGAYQPAVGAVVGERAAAVVQELAARPQDPAGRRDLLVELVRLTFEIDLAATVASSEFRSYLALRAAVAGVESDELRGRIVAALAVGDRRAVARGAAILARAAELFGLRLVAPLTAPEGFEVVARALTATNVGFVVALHTDPGPLMATREVAAYGCVVRAGLRARGAGAAAPRAGPRCARPPGGRAARRAGDDR